MKYEKYVQETLAQWDKEYKKGFTSYIILVFLKEKAMYGYELKLHLEELTNNTVLYGDSGIYQILKKLSEKKLVTTTLEKSDKGPPRKYYTITKSGVQLVEEFTIHYVVPTNNALNKLVKQNFSDLIKKDSSK